MARGRQTKRYGAIKKLLEDAQSSRRCYAARDWREARLLRRRSASGELVEVFPRQFMRAGYWGKLRCEERAQHIIRAYAQRRPDTVFCLFSAAVLHGLPVSYHLLDRLCIRTRCSGSKNSDAHIWRCSSVSDDTMEVDGILVTPVVQTTIDCMRFADFPEGLVLCDALLRELGIEKELLNGIVEHCAAGRMHAEQARRVAEFADGRAESGGESIARAAMIDLGIPPSDLQPEFANPVEIGRRIRPDFMHRLKDGTMVLSELDGRVKYEDKTILGDRDALDVLLAERQRESRISLLGMSVVRFTMRDVYNRARLARLFAAAGVTPETVASRDYRSTTRPLKP